MQNTNARRGLFFFTVYAVCYAAFVLVNALAADWMEATVFLGLNLAIVSGFGLIVLALVLALAYGAIAKSAPNTGEQS